METVDTALSQERRHSNVTAFVLVPIDPRDVVAGHETETGFESDQDVTPVGKMREHCPHCPDTPLQLVLRFQAVKRSHLFCPKCTRCFAAFYQDGSPVLDLAALPLD